MNKFEHLILKWFELVSANSTKDFFCVTFGVSQEHVRGHQHSAVDNAIVAYSSAKTHSNLGHQNVPRGPIALQLLGVQLGALSKINI